MISFSVDYNAEHNALIISATMKGDSSTTACVLTDDKTQFAKQLQQMLDCVFNNKRSSLDSNNQLILKPALSEGI